MVTRHDGRLLRGRGREHPAEVALGPGADLRGADLQGFDLRGADLQGADLQGAKLREADLQDANLQGAARERAPELTNTTGAAE